MFAFWHVTVQLNLPRGHCHNHRINYYYWFLRGSNKICDFPTRYCFERKKMVSFIFCFLKNCTFIAGFRLLTHVAENIFHHEGIEARFLMVFFIQFSMVQCLKYCQFTLTYNRLCRSTHTWAHRRKTRFVTHACFGRHKYFVSMHMRIPVSKKLCAPHHRIVSE